MIALDTMYSFALFSSLNNLKPASLTGTLRVGKKPSPRKTFSLILFTALCPTTLPPPTRPSLEGDRKGRAEPNAHTALSPEM